MYGAVIGDIIGSVYEGSKPRPKDFPLFVNLSRPTDDSVCTIAVADCLLNNGDPAEYLRRWCNKYPNAGYGGMFRSWMRNPEAPAYGSWGNGAAMRISPVGFFANSIEVVACISDRVTEVTHNHPEALRCARATAAAIHMARSGRSVVEIRNFLSLDCGYDMSRSIDEIRPTHRFDVSCPGTLPPALTCALEAKSYEDAIRNAVSLGGDVDTIACIAGGLAEALFGVPEVLLYEARQRMPAEFKAVLDRMYSSRLAD